MHVNIANDELCPFAVTDVAGHHDLTSASTSARAIESRPLPQPDLVPDIGAAGR